MSVDTHYKDIFCISHRQDYLEKELHRLFYCANQGVEGEYSQSDHSMGHFTMTVADVNECLEASRSVGDKEVSRKEHLVNWEKFTENVVERMSRSVAAGDNEVVTMYKMQEGGGMWNICWS